jgi:hypothetical protein
MSNEKKQTAVEWYIEKLLDLDYEYGKGLITLAVWSERKKSLIKQAKEMEKEQIKKAIDSNYTYNKNQILTIGEQYYNETYGGNK